MQEENSVDPQQGDIPTKKSLVQSRGMLQVESPELIKWQLESEETIEDLKNQLLGLVYAQNEEGEWYVVEKGKTWCNEKGAIALTSILRPYLNKAFTLSNYDSERINKTLLSLSITLTQYIAYHYKIFKIDEGDLSMIKSMIMDMIEANLWRAYQMKTFEGQQATVRSIEEFKRGESPKSKPFPLSISGIGKRLSRK